VTKEEDTAVLFSSILVVFLAF